MTDRVFEMQQLRLADRHIGQAEQLVLDQEREIQRLRLKGHDSKLAEKTLEVFRNTLQIMCNHRETIARTIQRIDEGLD